MKKILFTAIFLSVYIRNTRTGRNNVLSEQRRLATKPSAERTPEGSENKSNASSRCTKNSIRKTTGKGRQCAVSFWKMKRIRHPYHLSRRRMDQYRKRKTLDNGD